MARRRGFTSELLKAYSERQRARERARQQAERTAEKAWKEQERRVDQELKAKHRREAEAAQERRRAEQRTEQLRKQGEREKRRADAARRESIKRLEQQRAQDERERQKREAAEKRERDAKRAEEKLAEAGEMTVRVRRQMDAIGGLIAGRRRDLHGHRSPIDDVLESHDETAVAQVLGSVLSASPVPSGYPRDVACSYDPESRELRVQRDFPGKDAVPTVSEYKYVRSRGAIEPVRRRDSDVRNAYEQVVARLTLRTLAEAFDATSPGLVTKVSFNGFVATKDRATGRAIHPCLASVSVVRERFEHLVLDEPELDPAACLRYLNALVSAQPLDFEAVRPVVEFDLSRYKFIEEVDVISGLDSRPDLLDLTPGEFEQLVRSLFEARGGVEKWVRVTQGSRDEGVDALVTIKDPLVSGLYVIQAKRYSKVVGLESVHALAGVMAEHKAIKGILVTTAWVGDASRKFAENHRIEIIEGRDLMWLLKEYLDKDVRIGLAKVPARWQRHERGRPAK